MTTDYDDEGDPYVPPFQRDIEDELELEGDDDPDGEDDDDELETVDLEEAAAEFRMRYYGPDNNPQPPAAMLELAPDVMGLVDAVVYGEIYNRPAVDLRTRSLCTIAALVVLGHSPQLIKRHITGALNIGVTEEEISEIIAQMIFYGGMPAAVNAFRVAKETFDEQAERHSGAAPPERAPRETPSGYAPPYRRESVGNYGPADLEGGETPRVRPRVGPGQEAASSPPQGRGGFDRVPGSSQRDRAPQRGGSPQRDRPAPREGSPQRDRPAPREGSPQRDRPSPRVTTARQASTPGQERTG